MSGLRAEGSFVERRAVRRGAGRKHRGAVLVASVLVVSALMLLTVLAVAVTHPGRPGAVAVRATEQEALQNWTEYIFHIAGTSQNRTNFTEVVLGLKSDPNVIFNGALAQYFRNETAATFLSTLVNNYTYFFDNASGGGHWFDKELAAGAINGSMINIAYQIYKLHPELYDDMDFLFLLSQTKNFQDGLNATDKQILNEEVAAWENLQAFEKRFLLMFPVNATTYTETPGDLLYSLFSYYANQWGIDPSNVTQAKILLAYDAVFDGFYAIKHVANGQSETQFLNNYILKQAPAIGIDYLKLLASLKSGAVGLSFAINPLPYPILFGIYKDTDNTEALEGAQYEDAFVWLNETPRGYPNAYADARAFWNQEKLNETTITLVNAYAKVGNTKDNNFSNPIDNLFDWIYNKLSNGETSTSSNDIDPGPQTFNDLYMKYYMNITSGKTMPLDCSGVSPLLWYLTISQPYLLVRENNTITNNSDDPNIIAPFKVENVQVYSHMGSTALAWNETANEFGFGNSWRVMHQVAEDVYEYYAKFPTYPRYMVRANTATADQLYYNVPGGLWTPIYNRQYINLITNNTPLSELQRETFGAMIDNDYNEPYGATWNGEVDHPYDKYNLTGSNFPPLNNYGIPTDKKVTGVPQVSAPVPELNGWLSAVLLLFVACAARRRR